MFGNIIGAILGRRWQTTSLLHFKHFLHTADTKPQIVLIYNFNHAKYSSFYANSETVNGLFMVIKKCLRNDVTAMKWELSVSHRFSLYIGLVSFGFSIPVKWNVMGCGRNWMFALVAFPRFSYRVLCICTAMHFSFMQAQRDQKATENRYWTSFWANAT